MLLGSDVVLENKTVTFGAMDMQANMILNINNDNILELEEQFGLTLIVSNRSKMLGVEEGVLTSATGRIRNDDGMCLGGTLVAVEAGFSFIVCSVPVHSLG